MHLAEKPILKGRRGARIVALKILYSIDIRNIPPNEAIDLFYENFVERSGMTSDGDTEINLSQAGWDRAFMEFLVRGVWSNRKDLDKVIEDFSENWKVYRMSVIDRNIIRIAVFEMLYCPEIPPKVSINEAIELGKMFGDKDSAAFINGILDKVYRSREVVESAL